MEIRRTPTHQVPTMSTHFLKYVPTQCIEGAQWPMDYVGIATYETCH